MTSNFDLTHHLDLGFSKLDIHIAVSQVEGCELDMMLDGAWQIDRPSNGSM